MEIERRQRPPWKPQRGELIRLPGTSLAIPEVAGFWLVMAMAFCIVLLIIAVVTF